MKEQLTDEMILAVLSKSPMPMLIIGIATLIIGIIICIVIIKSSRYKNDKRILILGGPFLCFGALFVILGISKLIQKPPTMDSFVVKKCEIIDMYERAKHTNSGGSDYDYYIVCEGYDEAIKVTYQEYFREYELGDYMYLVVKADDKNYLYRKYREEEYEYVGNKLVD